ncbi:MULTISPECIES: GldG family protein [Porphyromonadaceae]|uniref:ABC transporter n=1 Tax=Sanguibacteroides justesenii TaxID=1547597 RepID=A0AB34R7E3_9PORP|nr:MULTISPECIES: GldG family protein [Porphyromonadaceae]KIO47074.1 ABC transporter [Sanguibacteroides justesenii]PXZ43722.1 ABC transporter [Sanguibacteroides justesenii]
MRNKIFYHPAYLIVLLIIVNIVAYFTFVRIDMTSNKKYSLSQVSKSFIKKTDKDITIDLYISQDISQEKKKVEKEFKNLLKEYKSLSNKGFTINTINPDNEEKKHAALDAGIEYIPQEINEIFTQTVFFGATIRIGDRRTTIPYLSSHMSMEYEMTRILKEACDTLKPRIGFLRGHNEIPLSNISHVINELSSMGHIDFIYIDQFTNLNDYKVICIVGPEEKFLPQQIRRLEEYLEQGGRLYIALNHAVGQIGHNQNTGFINQVGIEEMLENFGLKIEYDFIVDRSCGTITIKQNQFRHITIFPYIPIIRNFSKHIITKGLNAIVLQFASSIKNVKTTHPYVFTSLAKSSSISGVEEIPVFFNLMKTWTKHDFNHPNNTVAALLTNEDNNSAIVVITDADFMQNDIYNFPNHDNTTFAVNSIEWLADDSGLINLRNKFITHQVLPPISDGTKIFCKNFNFFLPILCILALAFFMYRKSKIKRLRRSQPGYID